MIRIDIDNRRAQTILRILQDPNFGWKLIRAVVTSPEFEQEMSDFPEIYLRELIDRYETDIQSLPFAPSTIKRYRYKVAGQMRQTDRFAAQTGLLRALISNYITDNAEDFAPEITVDPNEQSISVSSELIAYPALDYLRGLFFGTYGERVLGQQYNILLGYPGIVFASGKTPFDSFHTRPGLDDGLFLPQEEKAALLGEKFVDAWNSVDVVINIMELR